MGADRCTFRAAAGILAVALLAACAGSPARHGSTTGTAAAGVTLPLEQPATRCGPPGVTATLPRFPSSDGVQLSGVMVGRPAAACAGMR
jgi:hypothetical protein